MTRAELIAQLGGRRFDLLIVGGGIVGAGIARDAAMRGLSVALIDQGDFASGTSSKTSKLIHGGLRYLEHGHLSLVMESLRERKALRAIAPTLVHPISLLLPVFQGDARSAWNIRMGLWLYALLAWGDQLRAHRMVSARKAAELEPRLQRQGLRAAGLYADCQMDDARLCLANILQAIDYGAVCCNYVRLRSFVTVDHRVCGGIGEDRLSGRSYEIHAKVVVNATGPWADQVRRLSDADAAKRLAPTKGIHLILPRLIQHGLFVQARSDGRMVFLLPWGDSTLVGTTESPVGDPLEPLRASREEVGYLLDEVNQVLAGVHLREQDVVATFAGARPLLAFSGSARAASREHRIELDRWGLVSVMGGKYTTYRRMAQQTVECVLRRHRWASPRCQTDRISVLEAADLRSQEFWQYQARRLDADLLGRLVARYGRSTVQVLRLIERDPSLTQPVCPHFVYVGAEVVHAIRHELACSMTDVLARRTRMAFSRCQGLDSLSTVRELFHRYGGFPASQVEQQVEEYRRFLADGLAFRSSSDPPRSLGADP